MKTKKQGTLWVAALVLLAILTPDSHAADDGIWHIKAVHPEGWFLDVKALDKEGKIHSVKAIETSGNLHVMDVKAMVGGGKLPVKILVSDDKFAPVKAIGPDGAQLPRGSISRRLSALKKP